MKSSLDNTSYVYFRIKVDNASDVQVVNQITKQWYPLDRFGSFFAGNVPVNSAPVVVLAKFDRGNRYWALVEYK